MVGKQSAGKPGISAATPMTLAQILFSAARSGPACEPASRPPAVVDRLTAAVCGLAFGVEHDVGDHGDDREGAGAELNAANRAGVWFGDFDDVRLDVALAGGDLVNASIWPSGPSPPLPAGATVHQLVDRLLRRHHRSGHRAEQDQRLIVEVAG